jgi:hypothetical protein
MTTDHDQVAFLEANLVGRESSGLLKLGLKPGDLRGEQVAAALAFGSGRFLIEAVIFAETLEATGYRARVVFPLLPDEAGLCSVMEALGLPALLDSRPHIAINAVQVATVPALTMMPDQDWLPKGDHPRYLIGLPTGCCRPFLRSLGSGFVVLSTRLCVVYGATFFILISW